MLLVNIAMENHPAQDDLHSCTNYLPIKNDDFPVRHVFFTGG